MIIHRFELLSKLNRLVEALTFRVDSCLDLFGACLDDLLEFGETLPIGVQFHVLLCLCEGHDQLAAGLAFHLNYL